MQEEEAKAEIFKNLWKKIKAFIYDIFKHLAENRKDICKEIVGSGKKISTPDKSCTAGLCRSCNDICASSGEEGLTWQCKSGYNQPKSLKISCDSTKNDKTFCCCVEANTNMQFHF